MRSTPTNHCLLVLLIALLLLAAAGCEDDKRVVEVAREAADRQAEQNRQMGRQTEDIATATRELIEADARSRQEMVALHRELQNEQAVVARQRDALETERRELARARQRESLLIPVLQGGGGVLVVVAALVFCAFLLAGLRHPEEAPQALGELLVEELSAERPLVLPRALLPSSDPSLPQVDHDADVEEGADLLEE